MTFSTDIDTCEVQCAARTLATSSRGRLSASLSLSLSEDESEEESEDDDDDDDDESDEDEEDDDVSDFLRLCFLLCKWTHGSDSV